MVTSVVLTFVVLVALSTPIVFALGFSGMVGLVLGNFSLQKLPSALVAGSQSWVLLAVPTFVFAGSLMERCGMSYALVNLARGLVGWVRGAGWAGPVGGARRLLLLGNTRFHDRRRVGHRSDAAPADAARGVQAGTRRLPRRLGDGHGHPGAAGHLHDRPRPDHGHVGRGHLSRWLHSGGRHGALFD